MNILDLQVGLDTYAGPGTGMIPICCRWATAFPSRGSRAFQPVGAAGCAALGGNDLRNMSQATKETLTNRDVIAVDQDPLGIEGSKVRDDGAKEIWAKPLKGGAKAVILLNRGEAPVRIKVTWPSSDGRRRPPWCAIFGGSKTWVPSATALRRGAPHGVVMLRLSPAPVPAVGR